MNVRPTNFFLCDHSENNWPPNRGARTAPDKELVGALHQTPLGSLQRSSGPCLNFIGRFEAWKGNEGIREERVDGKGGGG